MKFEVTSRWTGEVKFTAEIACDEAAERSVKLGLAVQWAIKSGADLSCANLSCANLYRVNLSGVDLCGAILSGANFSCANLYLTDFSGVDLSEQPIIDGGLRSDGYRFFFTNFEREGPRIQAGCRNFEGFAAARQYWLETRGGTALGDETFAILDHLERMAVVRGFLEAAPQARIELA